MCKLEIPTKRGVERLSINQFFTFFAWLSNFSQLQISPRFVSIACINLLSATHVDK